jgi:hypothetical protein
MALTMCQRRYLREPPGETYYRAASRHGLSVPVPTVLNERFGEAIASKPAIDYSTSAQESSEDIWQREEQWWREVVARVFGPDAACAPSFETCFSDVYQHFASGAAWVRWAMALK